LRFLRATILASARLLLGLWVQASVRTAGDGLLEALSNPAVVGGELRDPVRLRLVAGLWRDDIDLLWWRTLRRREQVGVEAELK
jgi:hypothetical protein